MNQSCPWPITNELSDFCEADLCSLLVEPGNTLSNLAFVFIGIWIWRDSAKRSNNYLKILSVVCVLTGICSGLFHATGLSWAGKLDMAALYLGTGAMTALNVRRWLSWSIVPTVLVFLVTSSGLMLAAFAGDLSARMVYALGAPCCLIELRLFFRDRSKTSYKHYVIAWLTVGVAFFFWWLDTSRTWCDSDNHFISGHVLWHVLAAVAFWCFYKFYRQFSHFQKHPDTGPDHK